MAITEASLVTESNGLGYSGGPADGLALPKPSGLKGEDGLEIRIEFG